MANQNTAYGLQPLRRIDGAVWNDTATVYYVHSTNSNALYVGDPVIKIAGSADINGINGVDLASAGTGNKITGVVVGFLGSCAHGAPNGAGGQLSAVNMFASAGTPGPMYRPASTSLDYYVLVNDDPEAMFVVQENDSGGALGVASVGKNANLASGSGSAYTGWSGWQLAANQTGTTNTRQLRILGFDLNPVGSPGSANAKVIVQINTHTELPNSAGI